MDFERQLVLDDSLNSLSINDKVNFLLERLYVQEGNIIAIDNSKDGKPFPAFTNDLPTLLSAHMTGKIAEAFSYNTKAKILKPHRVGFYLVKRGTSKCKFICIDIDGGDGHLKPLADPTSAAIKITQACKELGLIFLLEKSLSGEGYHIWILFDSFVEASDARELGKIVSRGDFPLAAGGMANPSSNIGIEIFPKQAFVKNDKFGNLIWLPWYHKAQIGNNLFYNIKELEIAHVEQ